MRKLRLFIVIPVLIMLTACSSIDDWTISKDSSSQTQEQSSSADSSQQNTGTGQVISSTAAESTGTGDLSAAAPSTADRVNVTLYYQDTDGYLVPVTRKIAKQEGIARAAILGLVDSSVNRESLDYYGLYPVFPEGTEIRGLSIKDGIATIDFNDKLLDYSSESDERNIVCSIIYTLTEFKSVDKVKILVAGKNQVNLKYKTDASGELSRASVMINANNLSVSDGFEKIDVYLYKRANNDYVYLVPFSCEEPAEPDRSGPEWIFNLLGSREYPEGLSSDLPNGVSLLQSTLKGDTLVLDVSADFRKYGGSAKEDSILKELLMSMKQIKGVKKVQLLVEGEMDALPEGTDISKPIAVPSAINDVIE